MFRSGADLRKGGSGITVYLILAHGRAGGSARRRLGDEQEIKFRFNGGHKLMAVDQRNATIVGKQEIVVQVAFAT